MRRPIGHPKLLPNSSGGSVLIWILGIIFGGIFNLAQPVTFAATVGNPHSTSRLWVNPGIRNPYPVELQYPFVSENVPIVDVPVNKDSEILAVNKIRLTKFGINFEPSPFLLAKQEVPLKRTEVGRKIHRNIQSPRNLSLCSGGPCQIRETGALRHIGSRRAVESHPIRNWVSTLFFIKGQLRFAKFNPQLRSFLILRHLDLSGECFRGLFCGQCTYRRGFCRYSGGIDTFFENLKALPRQFHPAQSSLSRDLSSFGTLFGNSTATFHQISLFLDGPQGQTGNNDVNCRDVYDDPFGSQELLPRFLWGCLLAIVGFWLDMYCGRRWIDNHMRWWHRSLGLVGLILLCMGLTLLILGHAWPPKQECSAGSEYHPTFQHDGENVSQKYRLKMVDSETIPGMGENPRNTVRFLWQKWPPGICISMLAGAAAVFPIVTPSELTPIDKAKWIAGLGFLLVLELVIIFKERRRQDREFAEDQAKRDAAHFEQIKNLQELRQASDGHNSAVMRQFMAMNDPIGSLKRRAIDLSESILDFAYSRIQGKPSEPTYSYTYPGLQEWDSFYQDQSKIFEDQRKAAEYSRETWDMYQGRFYAKAVNIRDEFAKENLADDALNRALSQVLYTTVENTVRVVGERLGFLADKCNTKIIDQG